MKAIVPIQPAVQIPSTKYSNRTYITPGYALPIVYIVVHLITHLNQEII